MAYLIRAQVDEQTQLPGSSTQQSVAMSSQRTAQYHWGATPQPPTQHPTQQDRQLPGLSHAGSQAQPQAARQEAGSAAAASHSRSTGQAASAPGAHRQQQQVQGHAGQEKPHLPPTGSGVSTWPHPSNILVI